MPLLIHYVNNFNAMWQPVPMVVAGLAELYRGLKTSVPQAIGNTTVPMTANEQQPSTSTHTRTYSGPNKGVPQATSDRTPPMAEDKQQPFNLDGQHSMTKNRNRPCTT